MLNFKVQKFRLKYSSKVRQSIIKEYIGFCQTFDKFKKEAKTDREKLNALKTTMEYCVNNDILQDILLVKKKEVEDIMMTVFSQEQALEFALKARYREGMAQGIEQGIEQGKSTGKLENSLQIAKKMKDSNMDTELIINFTGLSEEEVAKL